MNESKEKWVTPTQKEKGEEKIEMSKEERKEYLGKVKEEASLMNDMIEKGEAKDFLEASEKLMEAKDRLMAEQEGKEYSSEEGYDHHFMRGIRQTISVYPELSPQIAKTLSTLLKIRKSENYLVDSLFITTKLEEKAKQMQFEKNEEDSLPINLHDLKKAVVWFSRLPKKEVERVEKEIEAHLPKPKESLEKHISVELGLETEEMYDPDKVSGDKEKLVMATLRMIESDNVEDFQLRSKEPISSEKLDEIIEDYYNGKGYEVKKPREDTLYAQNKEEKKLLMITTSNYGNVIMVSATRMPYREKIHEQEEISDEEYGKSLGQLLEETREEREKK